MGLEWMVFTGIQTYQVLLSPLLPDRKQKKSTTSPEKSASEECASEESEPDESGILECGFGGWSCEGDDLDDAQAYLECLICTWAADYTISNFNSLPADRIRGLIASVKDYCAVKRFSQMLKQLIVIKAIYERFHEQPFAYLDGKKGSGEADDPEFAQKLQYLFKRFYETNPRYAVLWKFHTQRLANPATHADAPNLEFGKYHADRREQALGNYADELLDSQPLCWLLKELPVTSDQSERRREAPTNLLREGCELMIKWEMMYGGRPTLHGLAGLPDVYDKKSMKLDASACRPNPEYWDQAPILLVTLSRLSYDNSILHQRIGKVHVAAQAHVVPEFRPHGKPRMVERKPLGTGTESNTPGRDEDSHIGDESDYGSEVGNEVEDQSDIVDAFFRAQGISPPACLRHS
ncbi:uncharacterized protein BO97DRAFT_451419 [Aspergillus homomorphus CBS 101889]|uniref:Uncharacterized protein n=1 Tax=Aspergillus homomorphus (strain CBS 101889) TaxID=1450537 RepID=A0A395HY85_ASPHC|nr:hypothetical protein BO97DRAFT_451419 [Aspergillus homomorphus CBS 101889]RAL12747.1 hypothetical protein BO97DRAFT_451419 [Aspergillus homomorphus CBS 101889]